MDCRSARSCRATVVPEVPFSGGGWSPLAARATSSVVLAPPEGWSPPPRSRGLALLSQLTAPLGSGDTGWRQLRDPPQRIG